MSLHPSSTLLHPIAAHAAARKRVLAWRTVLCVMVALLMLLAVHAERARSAESERIVLLAQQWAAAGSSQQGAQASHALREALKAQADDAARLDIRAAPPALMLALAGVGLLVLGLGRRAEGDEVSSPPVVPAPAAGVPAAAAVDDVGGRRRLERTLAYAARHPDYGFALLALQLDAPEPPLHTLGQGAEQALHEAVLQRLQQATRPCDATWQRGPGALHLAVLMDGGAGTPTWPAQVQTLHAELSEPYTVNNHPVRLRVSLGAVAAAAAPNDVGTLLLDAELALAQSSASAERAPAPVFYNAALRESCQARQSATQGLAQAMQGGEFELWLQPVLALASGQLAGVRCELRWRHGQRGVLHAADFYAEAEEAGCAASLDTWQLQQALQLMAAWPKPVPLSLALAPGAVARHAQTLATLLQEAPLQAGQLELRLAEQELASEPAAQAALLTLRELGVRVALHGLAHPSASLSTLSRLPLAAVVIDGHFVHQAASVEAHAVLARAIVSLAASLGLDTQAEAVDDAAKHALMLEMGVMQGHGQALGAAMPAADFARWLAARG
jgi:EAL domain-containing protein (putative c-di-GMP-specific phosphodiesterase class I)